MNIAVIFAGGAGNRMNTTSKPKQFLELHGKPILVYTLEVFQKSPKIDGIVVAMLEDWIPYSEKLIDTFKLDKVKAVIPGGKNSQESIYFGVKKAYELFPKDSVVLVNDGVRPLIDENTIECCIDSVEKYGSAITVAPAIETVSMIGDKESVGKILPREKCQMVKAPQCFRLGEFYNAHTQAIKDKYTDFIDSASLMQFYGKDLHTISGTMENIKITTPGDFYIFRALVDAKENSQIFGL